MTLSPFSRLFGVDLRSLAVLRIGIALSLLADLLQRSGDLVAHYTDDGVLPGDALVTHSGSWVKFSIHYWASGSPWLEGAVFAVAAACAIALALGYRTRLFTILSWYLLLSLQARSPMLSSVGSDKLIRMLLFWSLFLPLGARWSVDAWRAAKLDVRSLVSNRLVSIPTAALLLQVALVYWATAIQKTGPGWSDGTAVWYALQLKTYVTPLGVWLRDFSSVLPVATYATMAVELLGPLLAFSPIANARARIAAIVIFWGFHLSLALFLDIGLFPVVSMVAWLAFIPSEVWDARRPSSVDGASLPMLPTPRWAQVLCGATFAYVVVFVSLGVAGRVAGSTVPLPNALLMYGRATGVNQYWLMFAPDAPRHESWVRFEGVREDGSSDLWTPDDIDIGLMSQRWSFRWRLWLNHLVPEPSVSPAIAARHARMGRFICAAWNGRDGDAPPVERLRTERITERRAQVTPLEVDVLQDYSCVTHVAEWPSTQAAGGN